MKDFYVEGPSGDYFYPCCGSGGSFIKDSEVTMGHCNTSIRFVVEDFEVEKENDLYYIGAPNTEVYCPACGKKAVSQTAGTFVAKNSQLNYKHDCGNMLVIVMGKARKNATIR